MAVPEEPPGETSGPGRRPSGALEAEVQAVVQAARAPVTPGQVQEQLALREYGQLSYSTVVTILTRLHTKGLLTRERSGRAFSYSAVDEASFAAARMSQALQASPGRDAVLAKFASGLSRRDARLLRDLLGDPPEPSPG